MGVKSGYININLVPSPPLAPDLKKTTVINQLYPSLKIQIFHIIQYLFGPDESENYQ